MSISYLNIAKLGQPGCQNSAMSQIFISIFKISERFLNQLSDPSICFKEDANQSATWLHYIAFDTILVLISRFRLLQTNKPMSIQTKTLHIYPMRSIQK